VTPSPEERSVSQLFGDSLSGLTKLVQNEINLARAELAEKVSLTTVAAKLVVAGAVLIIPGVILILLALAAELVALGLSEPLAYLCSGLGTLIVAVALAWAGVSRLSAGALKPSATLDQMRRDRVMATELMR
jgi:hypothetical protein